MTERSTGAVRPYAPDPDKVRLKADHASVLRAFALSGQGVAILPDWLIDDDLRSGRLVHVLPQWQFTPQGVYALYPDTRHLPLKVRAFIDFMKNREAVSDRNVS